MLTTGNSTVVMTRHGESEWSAQNIFCGWFNSPLTEKGNCSHKTIIHQKIF